MRFNYRNLASTTENKEYIFVLLMIIWTEILVEENIIFIIMFYLKILIKKIKDKKFKIFAYKFCLDPDCFHGETNWF